MGIHLEDLSEAQILKTLEDLVKVGLKPDNYAIGQFEME